MSKADGVTCKGGRDVDVHHLVPHPAAIVDDATLAVVRIPSDANDQATRTWLEHLV
jgi:hypothetical protein